MGISPELFLNLLVSNGTDYFTGVPDSLLKSFCSLLINSPNHITAVNEGAAVALASGYHLATGKVPLVYMQNSGIGNAVNPLLSLADPDVYRIPMLLLIGWRGEPGVKDEPQHIKQGKVTCALFEAMNIPYLILAETEEEVKKQIDFCFAHIKKENSPFVLIARKDFFTQNNIDSPLDAGAEMSREEAIETIITSSLSDEIFVSTTGMASRELYELREKHNMSRQSDFLTVGSMGHASSIALGIALEKKQKNITCIDGDGAALMHLGSIAAVGNLKPANFRHIVLNNASHDSVGGQPTIADNLDFPGIAFAAGYDYVFFVKNKDELKQVLNQKTRPQFIEVKVRKGNRKNLGRPSSGPKENKEAFMRFLAAT